MKLLPVLKEAYKLKYQIKPDYAHFKSLFFDILESIGYAGVGTFDWCEQEEWQKSYEKERTNKKIQNSKHDSLKAIKEDCSLNLRKK